MGPRSTLAVATFTGVVGMFAGAFALRAFGTATLPASSRSAPPFEASEGPHVPPFEPREVIVGRVTASLGEEERASLRTLIREELKAVHTPPPTPPSDAGVSLEQIVYSLPPSGAEAWSNADSLLDQAKRRGAWTALDRAQLHELTFALPSELRLDVLQRVSILVNSGELRVQGDPLAPHGVGGVGMD